MFKYKVFENYDFTYDGTELKCWSNKFHMYLKQWETKDGYQRFQLCQNQRRYSVNVHRIIAEQFVPNPENKICVYHIDGNRRNNSLENLRWANHRSEI